MRVIENHMVQNDEQFLHKALCDDLRRALEDSQAKEGVAGELYDQVQTAVSRLVMLGEDIDRFNALSNYVEMLCASYEAESEVLAREITLAERIRV